MLLSSRKGQTKVIVTTENDLFKVGSVWTANEIMRNINYFLFGACDRKKIEEYYKFREEYKEKIINALELKNK
jgi:hypothetical protein